MYRVCSLLVVAILIAAGGCTGSAGNDVFATVNYDDGTPVPQGTVRFISDNYETFGKIENGKVDIGQMDDGVPDGTYKVAVQATSDGDDKSSYGTPLVAQKFSNPNTSGIVVEVKGDKSIDIVVGKP
mmetsp:Transcript_120188/g.245671  ORF Transcript_120188/g.245671 Transcript_120188/m.245671 type:complete len:127 (-) Transcript_120188:174-554(-)